jgi:hypothetical protein
VNITTSNRLALDMPNNTSRSSFIECRPSNRNRPSGSPKTVTASENATLCLVRVAAAFRESHSKVRAIIEGARKTVILPYLLSPAGSKINGDWDAWRRDSQVPR